MLQGKIEKYLKEKRGAIHVGANVGEEREWYDDNGFKRVIWFEANPELFDELSSNLRPYPFQIPFNLGVHDTLKEGILHVSNNRGQSSSLLEFGTHAKNHPDVKYTHDVRVRLIRLDEFFAMLKTNLSNYNFLNIDVQGVELNVIKSFGELIEKMDYIYTEVNRAEVYKGCSQIQDIDCYLSIHGFERVENYFTKADWGDALYIRK